MSHHTKPLPSSYTTHEGEYCFYPILQVKKNLRQNHESNFPNCTVNIGEFWILLSSLPLEFTLFPGLVGVGKTALGFLLKVFINISHIWRNQSESNLKRGHQLRKGWVWDVAEWQRPCLSCIRSWVCSKDIRGWRGQKHSTKNFLWSGETISKSTSKNIVCRKWWVLWRKLKCNEKLRMMGRHYSTSGTVSVNTKMERWLSG